MKIEAGKYYRTRDGRKVLVEESKRAYSEEGMRGETYPFGYISHDNEYQTNTDA